MSEPTLLPLFSPGPRSRAVVRRPAAPGRARTSFPGAGASARRHAARRRRTAPPCVAIRYAERRGDGRRPARHRGLHDRQPPHREGVRGRRLLRRRDRGRGRARRSRWSSCSRSSSSTTRRCRATCSASRARPTSSASSCGPTCPPRCRASSSCRCSPATTSARDRGRVFSYDVTGGRYEELDYQAPGLGQRARPQLDQGRLARGHDRRRDDRPRDHGRCSPPPTRTSPPAAPTSCAASSRRSPSSTPTASARSTDDEVAARSRDPPAGSRAGRRRRHEHAVLRLARTGDEGPRRLRAEGHRPRSQPGRARVRGRRRSSSPTTRRARCQKISEIYDRIAFAAVGKYNEFQMLRIAGVRHADLKGYSYSREDVSAKELANAYAQTLGQIFTHEMKPYEVELLVAEVGCADDDHAEMYHVLYDGVVMDEQGYSVLGGQAEADHRGAEGAVPADGMEPRRRGQARRARCSAPTASRSAPTQLEVALLDRAAPAPRVPPHQERRARRPARLSARRSVPAQRRARPGSARSRRTGSRPRRRTHQRGTRRSRIGGRSSSRISSASSTSVDEQHEARLVDLVVGHVHVDPRHVADGEPVGTVERAPQLHVEALVLEPGGQHLGPERPVHRGEAGHRHRRHDSVRRHRHAVGDPYTAQHRHARAQWSGASSGSRTSTASPARCAANAGSAPTRSRATSSAGSCRGAARATSSSRTAPGSTSTSAATPSTRRPSATRSTTSSCTTRRGSASSRGLVQSAEQRLREEGIRGEVFLFKNNTDSAGNSYGCHENYLVERDGDFSKFTDVLIPFLVTPPGLRRRGQGAADRTRRDVLHRAARRAHLGRRVVGDHPVAPDHQHARRAARRRRAVPPAARDRRRLEHERVRDVPQGRRDLDHPAHARRGRRARGATSRSRTRSARSARSATTSRAGGASASPTAASSRRSRSSPSTSTARCASPSAAACRRSSSARSRCGST